MKYARANNISIMDAKQRLSTTRTSTFAVTALEQVSPMPSATEIAQQNDIDALREKINLLDSNLSKLVVDIQPLFRLER